MSTRDKAKAFMYVCFGVAAITLAVQSYLGTASPNNS
jgi:hypothetical protein